jgi:hypothetical protein
MRILDNGNLVKKRNHKGTVYYENDEGEILYKTCCKCLEIKPLTDFYKEKRKLGGRKSECKVCKKAANKNYMGDYYEKNKEREIQRMKGWRQANRSYDKERKRKYYDTNKDRHKATVKSWSDKNKDKLSTYYINRRSRKSSLPSNFTADEKKKVSERFEDSCALTGDKVDLHWDHVIPISTGRAGTVYENMIPLRADLNSSKSDENIFEWFVANKSRFNLPQDRFDSLINYLAELNGMTREGYREFVYECHTKEDEK